MLPLHVHRMLCMCAATSVGRGGSTPPSLSQSASACLSCLQLYVCVCVFAALPQYKRGHRKTASFGTILDVPKIVVTGISGPPGSTPPPGGPAELACSCGGVSVHLTWPLSCVSLHTIPKSPSLTLNLFPRLGAVSTVLMWWQVLKI